MTQQQTDNESLHENSLGDLLLKTRESLHKTLEEAAEATRINTGFLHALEQNDFGKLPDEIFIRGFIKLYATYLGLDPNDTFVHYITQENLTPHKPQAKLHRDDITNSALLDRTSIFIKKSSRILPVTILISILVLFYILGIFFKSEDKSPEKLQQQDTTITLAPVDQSSPADARQTSSSKKGALAPQITAQTKQLTPSTVPPPPIKSPAQTKQKVNIENVDTAEPSPAIIAKPAPAALSTTMIPPVEPVAPVTLPITVKVATAPGPALAQLGGTADTDYKYVLEARFEEDSLLRIKVDDRPQLQYNSQAGIVRIWKAHERITLDLDNRTGITLILNGQPLPITNIDGTTATINIPADVATSDNP